MPTGRVRIGMDADQTEMGATAAAARTNAAERIVAAMTALHRIALATTALAVPRVQAAAVRCKAGALAQTAARAEDTTATEALAGGPQDGGRTVARAAPAGTAAHAAASVALAVTGGAAAGPAAS